MAELRVLSGREVCPILEAHGFTRARQRGSQVIMRLRLEGDPISVPVPQHRELRPGRLIGIIEQCGLPRDLFEGRR